MSVSIQDIINQALENRAIALSSLSASLKEKESKEEELDFYDNYLFGDGGDNLGVINILELYYREIALGTGKITSRPALQGGIGSSKNNWKTIFNDAIRSQGDDGNGFYPPDSNNIGSLEFNESSNYLTTNELGAEAVFSTSVFKRINEVLTAATNLLNKRKEEVIEEGEEGPTSSFPSLDYYNDSEAANLKSSLNNLKSSLEAYNSYLNIIKQKIEYIKNEKNISFEEAGMNFNILFGNNDDTVNIPIIKNKIQDHLSNLQSEITYFDSFNQSDDISGQTGYNRSVFDAKLENGLNNLFTNASTGFKKTFTDRENIIKNIINFNNISGSFRKWLVFWIKQVIGKFDGALISINGIKNDTIPNANNSIKNANEAIETLLGEKYEEFLLKPEIFAAFYNPEIDEETGETISKNVGLIWSANLAANRYNIYRRNVTTSTTLLSNDTQWQESDRIKQFIDLNEAETMIRSDYTDKNLNPGIYVYRVKSFDTNQAPIASNRLDNKNTSSPQSDVVGKTYTIESVSENKIKLTEDISNPFVVCFISNKYYAVQKAKNNEVVLFENAPLNASKLEEIIGGVFVPE